MKMTAVLKIGSIALFALGLQACGLIYQQDIQQGNVVTDEMLNNLELGMSKTEAQYYLGTPLIEDPFHANRWDYFYAFRSGNDDEKVQSVITLWFDPSGRLNDIKGSAELETKDVTIVGLPGEGDLNSGEVVEETDNRSLWQRVKSRVLGQ